MMYRELKAIAIERRCLKQSNKKFKVEIISTELPILFVAITLRDANKAISVGIIYKHLKELQRAAYQPHIYNSMQKMVGYGFFTKKRFENTDFRSGNAYRDFYYVEPLLVLYLNDLEKRLRVTRWDY